jgi:hypothetical protein
VGEQCRRYQVERFAFARRRRPFVCLCRFWSAKVAFAGGVFGPNCLRPKNYKEM